MSRNGTQHPHGPTLGYIVQMHPFGWVGSVCHGVEDATKRTLLGGNPATLFKTRRAAQRVIKEARSQDHKVSYSILRVAYVRGLR